MNTKPDLRIALVQCSIISNDIKANLQKVTAIIERYAGECDLIVLPETITTGFSEAASEYAAPWGSGPVFESLLSLAVEYSVGICGSYLAYENAQRSNRFFLIDHTEQAQWQDKRHLFSLGGEPAMINAATERKILNFCGWRILPTICYDLRFPVWCRNVNNEYDILICVANWPKARREVWTTLLKARALENLAYSVGVNRIGEDAAGLVYTGDSMIINPRGQTLAACSEGQEEVTIATIGYEPLIELRTKFPVWQDADSFTLNL